jgi:hypothetical protein
MSVGTAVCHVCNKRHNWAWWPSANADSGIRVFDCHYRESTYEEYEAGNLYITCDGSITEVERVDTVLLYGL